MIMKIIIIITAIEFSLGGSSPYTIPKHSTNNTKHSKYKYTYYLNTDTYTHSLPRPYPHPHQFNPSILHR